MTRMSLPYKGSGSCCQESILVSDASTRHLTVLITCEQSEIEFGRHSDVLKRDDSYLNCSGPEILSEAPDRRSKVSRSTKRLIIDRRIVTFTSN